MATIVINWHYLAALAAIIVAVQVVGLISLGVILRRFVRIEITSQVQSAMKAAERESMWTAQIDAINSKIGIMYDISLAMGEMQQTIATMTSILRSIQPKLEKLSA